MNDTDTLVPLPPPPGAKSAWRAQPPRWEQVGLALAAIVGKVQAWETRGTQEERAKRLHNLYAYLSGGVEGTANPLGGLRQYRQFNDAAVDAAEVLLIGGPS